MTTMTISLPDHSLVKLKEKAARLGLSPEELVQASIDALLAQPDEEFQKAAEYVLGKNAELYQRLG